jgi:hypothetical protein
VPATLLLGGKLGGWGVTAAASHPGTLFFITDTLTGRRFLVDTGSSFSLIPYRSSKRQCGPILRAADNRRIPFWGFAKSTVKLANGDFTWSFLRAAVKYPILGMDFLWNFRLLVDPVDNRLLTKQDLPPMAAVVAAPLAAAATEDPWQALLQEFPTLAEEMSTTQPPSHGIQHSIETAGLPVTAKFRRLDPDRLSAA